MGVGLGEDYVELAVHGWGLGFMIKIYSWYKYIRRSCRESMGGTKKQGGFCNVELLVWLFERNYADSV